MDGTKPPATPDKASARALAVIHSGNSPSAFSVRFSGNEDDGVESRFNDEAIRPLSAWSGLTGLSIELLASADPEFPCLENLRRLEHLNVEYRGDISREGIARVGELKRLEEL